MEILKPIKTADIPAEARGPHPYTAIYEKVLALDGLALPITFETLKEAANMRTVFSQKKSKARKLGLGALQRGKTVFIYRK